MEPSAWMRRTVLAIICEAYDEEELVDDKGKKDVRTVLRFVPRIAPIKAASSRSSRKTRNRYALPGKLKRPSSPG